MRILIAVLACAAALAQPATTRADEFDSAGVKIHYVVQGHGDPVILIHGLYASAAINWGLPGITADLAKHYRVIAYDNRGHGQSDKPEAEDQYGVPMAEDVVRLMDHLNIPKAHVVGYSMGGMITMKLLTLHPDRVSTAVLGGMGWLRENSPLDRVWQVMRPRNSGPAPVACLHGLAKLGVTEAEVKAIHVPVIIIVGDRDPCRQLYVEPLARVRPDWPVHIIANAGHLNCITQPDFKTQLEAALAATSSPRGEGRDEGKPQN